MIVTGRVKPTTGGGEEDYSLLCLSELLVKTLELLRFEGKHNQIVQKLIPYRYTDEGATYIILFIILTQQQE
jgi:hypothetical protein